MLVIVAQMLGVGAFALGTVALGLRARRQANRYTARKTQRSNRLLVRGSLFVPAVFGIFHPGLGQYDALLGLSTLSFNGLGAFVGGAFVLAGLSLATAAHRQAVPQSRRATCQALYKLSRKGVYKQIRHPMALGGYLAGLGAGLFAGSTAVTLGILGVIVPLHAVNLLFVEESVQEVLHGSAYVSYRRRVPFLVPRPHRFMDVLSS